MTVTLVVGDRALGTPIQNTRIGIVRLLDFPDMGAALAEARRLYKLGLHIYRITDRCCEKILLTGAELEFALLQTIHCCASQSAL